MKIEFVIATCNSIDNLQHMMACLCLQTSKDWTVTIVHDGEWADRLFWRNGDIRFLEIPGPNGDWGHTPIQYGKSLATERLLCMTSDDNYYVPTFVEEMLKPFEDPKCAFAYCDMIHNGYDYKHFSTAIAQSRIDIGCFVTLTELAKQIPLKSGYNDDFTFVKEYTDTFCRDYHFVKKIKKTLYVHN